MTLQLNMECEHCHTDHTAYDITDKSDSVEKIIESEGWGQADDPNDPTGFRLILMCDVCLEAVADAEEAAMEAEAVYCTGLGRPPYPLMVRVPVRTT